MHPLTKLASKLYPKWWRDRYGDEFAALLEDARPGLGGAFDIAKSALAVQTQSWSARRTLWSLTLLGSLIGLIAAYFWTPQFTSKAVVGFASTSTSAKSLEEIRDATNAALSADELAFLIRNLAIYPTAEPDSVEKMRRSIRIVPLTVFKNRTTAPAFAVEFDHPERFIANRVVSALISRIIDASNRKREEGAGSTAMELYDAASLPVNPNLSRSDVVIAGAGTGLFAGSLMAWALRKREQQARSPLKRAWAFIAPPRRLVAFSAFVGVLAVTIFTLWQGPRYSSTAMLSLSGSGKNGDLSDAVNTTNKFVLSSSFMFQIIRRLDLYPSELRRKPAEEVLAQMRRDFHVTPRVNDPRVGDQGAPTAIALSFTYSDPALAQRTVEEIAKRLLDANQRGRAAGDVPVLELAIPATSPERLDKPWRQLGMIGAASGAALGALLALALHLLRRNRTHPQPQ